MPGAAIPPRHPTSGAAFDGFDPEAVARHDAARVAALLADPRIVRNRLKVEATVQNARSLLAVHGVAGQLRPPSVGAKLVRADVEFRVDPGDSRRAGRVVADADGEGAAGRGGGLGPDRRSGAGCGWEVPEAAGAWGERRRLSWLLGMGLAEVLAEIGAGDSAVDGEALVARLGGWSTRRERAPGCRGALPEGLAAHAGSKSAVSRRVVGPTHG